MYNVNQTECQAQGCTSDVTSEILSRSKKTAPGMCTSWTQAKRQTFQTLKELIIHRWQQDTVDGSRDLLNLKKRTNCYLLLRLVYFPNLSKPYEGDKETDFSMNARALPTPSRHGGTTCPSHRGDSSNFWPFVTKTWEDAKRTCKTLREI